ncbi:hypothetical protein QBC35DRAFT_504838 [Podospora australis]|uniref:Uncharacterized protein n=1 Tax=Podospora australis TaxID=1536484 RepID=A0AAN6WN06_9PEZI|nr:hypothetical protein QBC35DRAFT_504838 [Podospora australis]
MREACRARVGTGFLIGCPAGQCHLFCTGTSTGTAFSVCGSEPLRAESPTPPTPTENRLHWTIVCLIEWLEWLLPICNGSLSPGLLVSRWSLTDSWRSNLRVCRPTRGQADMTEDEHAVQEGNDHSTEMAIRLTPFVRKCKACPYAVEPLSFRMSVHRRQRIILVGLARRRLHASPTRLDAKSRRRVLARDTCCSWLKVKLPPQVPVI